MIQTRILTGNAVGEVLDDLARLRIAVFRDWPYLYDGDVAYERDYLTAYQSPGAVVVGHPVYDASVPAARYYGRYATHIWVWINTLSLRIRDSMCGFRVYPLAPLMALARKRMLGQRMNFDTDVLVRLYWDGLTMVNLPTRVGYPSDGVSHFQLWRDNVLITRMHTRLVFGMLWRAPRLLARHWRAR